MDSVVPTEGQGQDVPEMTGVESEAGEPEDTGSPSILPRQALPTNTASQPLSQEVRTSTASRPSLPVALAPLQWPTAAAASASAATTPTPEEADAALVVSAESPDAADEADAREPRSSQLSASANGDEAERSLVSRLRAALEEQRMELQRALVESQSRLLALLEDAEASGPGAPLTLQVPLSLVLPPAIPAAPPAAPAAAPMLVASEDSPVAQPHVSGCDLPGMLNVEGAAPAGRSSIAPQHLRAAPIRSSLFGAGGGPPRLSMMNQLQAPQDDWLGEDAHTWQKPSGMYNTGARRSVAMGCFQSSRSSFNGAAGAMSYGLPGCMSISGTLPQTVPRGRVQICEDADSLNLNIHALGSRPLVEDEEKEVAALSSLNGVFTLMSEWASLMQKTASDSGEQSRFSFSDADEDLDDPSARNSETGVDSESRLRHLVLHPGAPPRATWEILSICLVFYDGIFLPLQFLVSPDGGFFVFMAWLTRLFWTADMPLSFLTGYLNNDGSVEMRFRKIARRYVATWFSLDLFLITIDWSEALLVNSVGFFEFGRLGKISRIFRFLRMIRLLRVVRMRSMLSSFSVRSQSEKVLLFAAVLRMLGFMLMLAHLIACLWHGVATTQSEMNWIIDGGFEDFSVIYQYFLALHWAFSLFQGGMDEIRPTCFFERVFTVFAFVMAFMLVSVVLSALTSSMTRLHILSSRSAVQLTVLRRWLVQNGISDHLTVRVQRNALHAQSEHQRLMSEDTVELLQLVSEPLRMDLHYEMYAPVCSVHPFFELYSENCHQVMKKVCHRAVESLLVSAGDIIFHDGELPVRPCLYIVCNGTFLYGTKQDPAGRIVEAREWLCEGSLWTSPWLHRGTLKATSDGRLCFLDAREFQIIAHHYEHAGVYPCTYGSLFVDALNKLREEDHTLVTDLPMGCEHRLAEQLRYRTQPEFTAHQISRGSMASAFGLTYHKVAAGVNKAISGGGGLQFDQPSRFKSKASRKQSVFFQ